MHHERCECIGRSVNVGIGGKNKRRARRISEIPPHRIKATMDLFGRIGGGTTGGNNDSDLPNHLNRPPQKNLKKYNKSYVYLTGVLNGFPDPLADPLSLAAPPPSINFLETALLPTDTGTTPRIGQRDGVTKEGGNPSFLTSDSQ